MKLTTVALSVFVASANASNFFQQLAGNSNPSVQSGAKVPGESPLYHCGSTSDDVLTIDKVDLVPNPPVPGQPLTIEASGTLHKSVEKGAQVEVTVKYGLITLIKETLDLCDHVGEVDLECPLKANKMILTKVVDIPKQVPPGKYNVAANAYLEDGDPITCLVGQVIFTR
ncbi:ML domain-containing protein [Morchella snyderi]|nr:ML domain-containing protein [Morchella snyderi]